MPNSCSAPCCKSKYYFSDDQVPYSKCQQIQKQALIRALRRDDIHDMKVVGVCIKHFREEDIETTHRVPKGGGTFMQVPGARPKMKEAEVPCLLPGCPSYYSTTSIRSELAWRMSQKKRNC